MLILRDQHHCHTKKISPSQFGLDPNNPSLQFKTKGGGFVQVFGPLKVPGADKFFQDPNPLVIRRQSIPVTYVQKAPPTRPHDIPDQNMWRNISTPSPGPNMRRY